MNFDGQFISLQGMNFRRSDDYIGASHRIQLHGGNSKKRASKTSKSMAPGLGA